MVVPVTACVCCTVIPSVLVVLCCVVCCAVLDVSAAHPVLEA